MLSCGYINQSECKVICSKRQRWRHKLPPLSISLSHSRHFQLQLCLCPSICTYTYKHTHTYLYAYTCQICGIKKSHFFYGPKLPYSTSPFSAVIVCVCSRVCACVCVCPVRPRPTRQKTHHFVDLSASA